MLGMAAASGALCDALAGSGTGTGVKLGILQPATGALSYSDNRDGSAHNSPSTRSMQLAASRASARSRWSSAMHSPACLEKAPPKLEKMNSAGVTAIVGGYGSSICLAASQAAARYDLPYVVDIGVADNIVTRGLKNTFRFGPGFGVIATSAIENLISLNEAAGKPAKTVMIVNEDSCSDRGLRSC